MENINNICFNCERILPSNGYFCAGCLTQIRCKSCDTSLLKDAIGCINCGTPKMSPPSVNIPATNTIKIHQTLTERSIEATFSDIVGKDLTGVIKDAFSTRISNTDLPLIHAKTNRTEIESDISENSAEVDVDIADIDEITHVPHLKDVEMNVNCSEADWILIYAYYESNFGQNTFTRQAVHSKYMDKRKTKIRIKNFSTNWKNLFRTFLATVNDNEVKFKITDYTYLENLIHGRLGNTSKTILKKKNRIKKDIEKESSETGEPTKVKAKPTKNFAEYSLVQTLNLYPKGKPSLKEFFNTYKSSNNAEFILIIVYYLQKIAEVKNIDIDHIYTCYKTLTLPVPNIKQALLNSKQRNGFINISNYLDLKITIPGENHLEHNMEKKQ